MIQIALEAALSGACSVICIFTVYVLWWVVMLTLRIPDFLLADITGQLPSPSPIKDTEHTAFF